MGTSSSAERRERTINNLRLFDCNFHRNPLDRSYIYVIVEFSGPRSHIIDMSDGELGRDVLSWLYEGGNSTAGANRLSSKPSWPFSVAKAGSWQYVSTEVTTSRPLVR